MVLNKKGASQEEISKLEPFRELRLRILMVKHSFLFQKYKKIYLITLVSTISTLWYILTVELLSTKHILSLPKKISTAR